jgi:DNA repair photolyase
MGMSIALIDESIHAALEPGTPTPRARLDLVRASVQAGLLCQVLVGPIVPITDSDEQIDALLGLIADAGATGATVFALHLRPGQEWFMQYLGRHEPELIDAYAKLYQTAPTSPAPTRPTSHANRRYCCVTRSALPWPRNDHPRNVRSDRAIDAAGP